MNIMSKTRLTGKAALLLTVLIATPVAAEFRYVYFMVFSLPFYIITSMLMLHHNTEEKI